MINNRNNTHVTIIYDCVVGWYYSDIYVLYLDIIFICLEEKVYFTNPHDKTFPYYTYLYL